MNRKYFEGKIELRTGFREAPKKVTARVCYELDTAGVPQFQSVEVDGRDMHADKAILSSLLQAYKERTVGAE